MVIAIIIVVVIALLFLIVIVADVLGPTTTRAMTVEEFLKLYPKEGTSTMKPKDLLDYLEKGDQTMEDLKDPTGFRFYDNLTEWTTQRYPQTGGLIYSPQFAQYISSFYPWTTQPYSQSVVVSDQLNTQFNAAYLQGVGQQQPSQGVMEASTTMAINQERRRD